MNESEKDHEARRYAHGGSHHARDGASDFEPGWNALWRLGTETSQVAWLYAEGVISRNEAHFSLIEAFRRCRDSQGGNGRG